LQLTISTPSALSSFLFVIALSSAFTSLFILFFFNAPPPPQIHPLSLHDALPIYLHLPIVPGHEIVGIVDALATGATSLRLGQRRSEEHTSELQSLTNLVCRLLLEKKKNIHIRK